MITSPEPKEAGEYVILVAGGTGSKIVNLSGYLDALIVDVPASETYTFSIKGPAGVEYYIAPSPLTGDTTVLFDPSIPMTGKMTFTVIGASGNGLFKIRPVGNLK